jgi:hypothetical protein
MKLTTMVILALGAVLVGTMIVDVWSGYGLYGFQALKPVHYLGRDSYDLSAVRRYPPHRMHPRLHVEQDQPGAL